MVTVRVEPRSCYHNRRKNYILTFRPRNRLLRRRFDVATTSLLNPHKFTLKTKFQNTRKTLEINHDHKYLNKSTIISIKIFCIFLFISYFFIVLCWCISANDISVGCFRCSVSNKGSSANLLKRCMLYRRSRARYCKRIFPATNPTSNSGKLRYETSGGVEQLAGNAGLY